MGQYRINISTNEKYKRGDWSEDGKKRFISYRTGHVKKDGFFAERWVSNEKFEEELVNFANKQRDRQSKNRKSNLPKRMNSETGKEFKPGEINSMGQYFIGYISGGRTASGYRGESWGTKDAWIRARVGNTFSKIQKRAVENNIPIDIDIDYLYAIFPLDTMKCPILETEMNFAGEKLTSPSVDRLVPKLGYTKGNVVWVSLLANVVKRERTPAQLRRIAEWIEEQPIYNKHFPKI